MADWQRYHEPLHATLTRTVGIAVVAGAVLAHWWGGIARWPVASLLMLWPSFGGHWLELWYLNWLRPRLSESRIVQLGARLAVWFVGGVGLALVMRLTATALTGLHRAPRAMWWAAGFAFILIELVVHLALQLRGRPSFFNGRG
jgi:hypothetical protein